MTHLSEEQLILCYYGEEGDALPAEQHLEACEECRALYASLQRVLNVVDSLPVPERDPEYGAAVWKRIEPRLPVRRSLLRLEAPWHWVAAAAACAFLVIAAFLAGRSFPRQNGPAQMAAADPQAGERVLLVAVGDFLERSQIMLVELANANPKGTLDISSEQNRAADLISESRLYRQTAIRNDEEGVAGFLDEIESVLLEIRNSPSRISEDRLERLRQRLRAEGILFKIRVLGSKVRDREEPAPSAAGRKL
jgi:hypothetical protein